LAVPAGGAADLAVAEERDSVNRIAISNLDSEQIRFYLQQPTVSERVKAQLAEAMRLQAQVVQARQELQRTTAQLDEIAKDQDRLRKNLKEMPPTAAAYKRYLEKFDQQETQIEKLQADQKRQGETVAQKQSAFEQFLSNLTVE
jgi:PHP family Zn ribbon phosphoesterase